MVKRLFILLLMGVTMNGYAQRIVEYEYWFDQDLDQKIKSATHDGRIDLSLDVSQMREGIHSLSFRAIDDKGSWSSPTTSFFLKVNGVKANNHLRSIEYWIDSTVDKKTTLAANGNTFDLNLDVSALGDGLHSITFRTQDMGGRWSAPTTQYFVRPLQRFKEQRIIGYQYWFNDGTAEAKYVKTEATSPLTMEVELPINSINKVTPETIELLQLDSGKPKMAVRNVLNMRFKDANLQWSEVLRDTFTTVVDEASVDLTAFIMNPDADQQWEGWQGGNYVTDDKHWSGQEDNYFQLQNGDMTQTVSGLPAGTYSLTLYGRTDNGVKTIVAVNGFSTEFSTDGDAWTQENLIFSTDGEPIDINISSPNGTSYLDDFRLTMNSASSLNVTLPETADMSDYRNLRLVLNSSQTELSLPTTLNRSYHFYGLSNNGVYSLTLQNRFGQIFARKDDIALEDGENTVKLEGLMPIKQVAVAVKDSTGVDVTAQTAVSWYAADGTFLAEGSQLTGIPEGCSVAYDVKLNDRLGTTYIEEGRQPYTVAAAENQLSVMLKPIPTATISGQVVNDFGNVYGANVLVRQWLNGRFTKTFTATTGVDGSFSVPVYNDSTEVTVGYNGYLDATVLRGNLSDVSIGTIRLQPVTGVVITPSITYQSIKAQDAFWADGLKNMDFSLHNLTTGLPVENIVVQNGQLIAVSGLSAGDHAELTVASRKGIFADMTLAVCVPDNDSIEVELPLVELGGLTAICNSTDNANDIGYLYDSNGQLVNYGSYIYRELSMVHLPAGQYTLVTMGQSQLMGNVLNLSELPVIGLQEGLDYVASVVNIHDGATTNIELGNIPLMEESKFYYTGQNTYFEANKTSLVAGNYVTLSSRIDFKEDYVDKVKNISLIVELPDGCEMVPNSAVIGASLISYTQEDRRITIPLTVDNYTDRVRFCVTPTNSGDYTATAFAQFDVDDTILQPIGSVAFEVEHIGIRTPYRIPSKQFVSNGTCVPYSQVSVYDGNAKIGMTTAKADGTWYATSELLDPIHLSRHQIHAVITTPANINIQTQTKELVYIKDCISVKSVTMLNTAHPVTSMELCENRTVFDFEHPDREIEPYWYWPSYPDFSFIVDFSDNDTTKVKNVKLSVLTSANEIVTLYPVYDEKRGKYVATAKFYSQSLPENVDVMFDDMTRHYLSREDVDRMFKERVEWISNLCQFEDSTFSTESDLRIEVKTFSESGITLQDLKTYMAIVLDDKSILYMKCDDDRMTFIDKKNDMYFCMYGEDVSTSRKAAKVRHRGLSLSNEEIDLYINNFEWNHREFMKVVKEIDKVEKLFHQLSYELLGDTPNLDYCIDLLLHLNYGIGADMYKEIYSKAFRQLGFVAYKMVEEGTMLARDAVEFKNYCKNAANVCRKIGNALGLISAAVTTLNLPEQMNKCIETLEDWKTLIKAIETRDCPKQQQLLNHLRDEAYTAALLTARGLDVDIRATQYSIVSTLVALIPLFSQPAGLVSSVSGLSHTVLSNVVLGVDAHQKDRIWKKIPMLEDGEECKDDNEDPDKPNDPSEKAPMSPSDPNSPYNGGNPNNNYDPENPEASIPGDPEYPDIPYGPGPSIGPIPTPPDPDEDGDEKRKPDDPDPEKTKKKKGKKGFPFRPVEGIQDPSGYVYEAVSSNRLEGVTVTCYQKTQEEDIYGDKYEVITKWDAEPYSQKNPLVTDVNGFYAWDVPVGQWQVKYEKDGYETVYSEWLPVPPPQLDVNVGMYQSVAPEVKQMRGYESGITVEMSKYMRPTSFGSNSITVMRNGLEEKGRIIMVNAEKDPYEQNREYASKVKFVPDVAFNTTDQVVVTVHKGVESYCGVKLDRDVTQTVPIEAEISDIVADSLVTMGYPGVKTLTVSVLPAEAASGKMLRIQSSSPMIAAVSEQEVRLNQQGKAELTVSGELPGGATLLYTIEHVDLFGETRVNVVMAERQVATPVASVKSGETVVKGTLLTLSTSTKEATIYYTLDGSCPCDSKSRLTYTGPIVLTEDVTIKVVAEKEGLDDSELVSFTYNVTATGVETVKSEPAGYVVKTVDDVIVIEQAAGCQLRIFDTAGLQVYEKQHLTSYEQVKGLPVGVYLVSVTSPGGTTIVQKVRRD